MKRILLRAGLLAAALAAGAAPARAADLDYGRIPTDRYSSAYEDPRYRDLYADPPRAYSHAPAPYYRGEPPPPVPPAYVYRDPPPYRYSEAPPSDWRYRNGCVPREEIKRRLVNEGWGDFQDLELLGNVARVNARRPSGDLFALKVDRCTGDIVGSRLIARGGHGPYAYDNGSRWSRPY